MICGDIVVNKTVERESVAMIAKREIEHIVANTEYHWSEIVVRLVKTTALAPANQIFSTITGDTPRLGFAVWVSADGDGKQCSYVDVLLLYIYETNKIDSP